MLAIDKRARIEDNEGRKAAVPGERTMIALQARKKKAVWKACAGAYVARQALASSAPPSELVFPFQMGAELERQIQQAVRENEHLPSRLYLSTRLPRRLPLTRFEGNYLLAPGSSDRLAEEHANDGVAWEQHEGSPEAST